MIKRTVIALLFAALCEPAFASQSPWVTSEGGSMRLIIDDNGTAPARGVLEITLKPGWKTYWRDPGDGGIPPSLSGEGTAIELLFPAPEHISENDLTFSGYHEGVSLPFVLPETLLTVDKLTAFIGVCSEICLPFQAEFSLVRDNADAQLVDTAFANLPQAAGEGEGVVDVSRIDQNIALKTANFSEGDMLFLAPEKGVYFSMPNPNITGFIVKVAKEKIPGVKVNYTLKTANGAVSGSFEMPK